MCYTRRYHETTRQTTTIFRLKRLKSKITETRNNNILVVRIYAMIHYFGFGYYTTYHNILYYNNNRRLSSDERCY